MARSTAKTIDAYIARFPPDVQALLQKMRATIQKAAPDAEETVSYGIPAFKDNGIVVYFGAFANHIGFFPTASGRRNFALELSAYAGAKGSVRFPFETPLPVRLIAKIVKFRVMENRERKNGKGR